MKVSTVTFLVYSVWLTMNVSTNSVPVYCVCFSNLYKYYLKTLQMQNQKKAKTMT